MIVTLFNGSRGSGGGGGIPVVGPYGTWNGTALSGSIGSAPNDTTGIYTRTSAGKPSARWIQPGEQRLWQDIYIGVAAYAQGGITSVVFQGDCATTTVAAPTLRTYTGSDGITKSNYAYWIKLSASLFNAIAQGTAQIFAVITATNGSMAPRVIGCANNDPVGSALTDWTHVFYVRTTESDFAKTIGSSGADYTTIDAFLNAARTANAEAPKGTFITTGSFPANNGNTGTAGTGSAKGRAVLVAQGGVTATINRSSGSFSTTIHSADYSTRSINTNRWRPGWPGIEFRGAGVVLDRQYWNGLNSNAGCWFNGCLITNSAGYVNGGSQTDFRYYCNGSTPGTIDLRDDSDNAVFSFFVDATNQYGSNNGGYNYLIDGLKQQYIGGPLFQNNSTILNTYSANCNTGAWYDTAFSVMTLYYSGAGSPAYSMTQSGNPTTMTLEVNGSTTYTISISDITGAGPLLISDLVTYINANCTNWHAAATTGTLGDYIGARYLGSASHQAVGTTSGTATVLQNSINIHVEITVDQGVSGNPQENYIHAYNTTAPNVAWNTGLQPFFVVQDIFDFNNAWVCGNASGGGDSGYNVLSNGYLASNDWDGGLNVTTSTATSNVIGTLSTVRYWHSNGTTEPTYPAWTNNLMALGAGHLPNNAASTGNVQIGLWTDPDYAALFANYTGGNYQPAGKKLTNLFAQVFSYDGNYNPRNMASDAAGSRAIGYSEPSRPF